jgi:Domain of unknown function (DUF4837)
MLIGMTRVRGFRAPALCALAVVLCGDVRAHVQPTSACSELLLVSEDGARDPAARALSSFLTRGIDYYIAEEQAFAVSNVRAAEVRGVPRAKNIVICGVANVVTDVGSSIASAIGDSAAAEVQRGGRGIFEREDYPRTGQLTMVVTASSMEDLIDLIGTRGDEIVDKIEASCRNRLRPVLLARGNDELTRRLRETYGFTIDVPRSYRLLSENSDPPGIELLCEAPARLLGVFWIDWDHEPALPDARALFRARASYVWKRYDGDVMDSTRVSYTTARLGEYPAVEMSGYWSNSRSLAGGYYETFFVYEKSDRILWAVDLLVFAPGIPKHPLFRELRALGETFRYD